MNHTHPPFGMDREVTQVQTREYITTPYKPGITTHTNPYYPPYGRPECFKKSMKPCGQCPWRPDCANAEGK